MLNRRYLFRMALLGAASGLIYNHPFFSSTEAAELPEIPLPEIPQDLKNRYAALGFNLESAFRQFTILQRAVSDKSPGLLKQLVAQSFILNLEEGSVTITRQKLADIEKYSKIIFSETVVARVKNQNFSAAIVNAQGVGVGRGLFWLVPDCISENCEDARLTLGVFNEPRY